MAIGDDFSVAANGDIRYTGSGTNYTGLAWHQWIAGLSDDEQAVVDDLVDITTEMPTDKSTSQILALNSPYNIDDTVARHLYNVSVDQNDGDDLYAGLKVLGPVETGTEVMIIQDDKILASYWGTGINPDAANNVVMQLVIKVRDGGADIDGKRVLVRVQELGDQYKEFPVTLGEGVSVAAVGNAQDLNNTTADATIEAWSTIANTEGYQEIDIDNDTVDEEYYAKFDKGSQSLNDSYEWSKQKQQRAHIADNGTDTGSDFVVDNATILGQGQEFTARAVDEKLCEARFKLKIGAGTPTGPLTAELYLSDDVGSGLAEPTGAVLATSEEVLASLITSTYQEIIFRFNDNVTMTADEKYFIVIRHPDGDASNRFAVEGSTSGADDGNRAEDTGTWAATAADDLWFTVKGSPVWHSRPGEKMRGITHEVVYDGGSGTFTEDEIVFWGTQITYDTLVSSFVVGEYVKFYDIGTSTVINGGKVLKDTGTILTVALENSAGSILADGDHITGLSSGATADINATITDDDKAGGEGVLLALDDNTGTGDLYIQLISGQAPVNDLPIVGRSSAASCLVNVTVTSRTVSPEFFGQSTGVNLIGAYGIGYDTNDVGNLDKFTALDNVQRNPPNNVTFTVTGLVATEDRVLVGPRTGTTLERGLWLLATALTGAGETAIVIKTGAEASPIATDTPQNGKTLNSRLRVELNTGIYRRVTYNSYSASTFATDSTDWSGALQAAVDNDVFPAYIDVLADGTTEAYTAVYKGSDRNIHVRVRDGGGTPIKTFEGNAVFGDTSSSLPATRQSDA